MPSRPQEDLRQQGYALFVEGLLLGIGFGVLGFADQGLGLGLGVYDWVLTAHEGLQPNSG